MNYDLAMMALEGMMRTPMNVHVEGGDVVIEGEGAAFKELARLCLLLGSAQATTDDGYELEPGKHLARQSMKFRMRLG